MITEQDREDQNKKQIEAGIRLCEEAVAKAEKYERLAENPDWKAYWNDIKILADVHQKEIELACQILPDAPNTTYVDKDGKVVSSKQDWADFIARHQTQRQEILTWSREPGHIIELARQSREALPKLKEKLLGFDHVTAPANGKS